jgi:ubiquinone/menaquinone biosynthesis C-methylase UbiE
MTVLEPKRAYALLAAEYDRTPNALISLEERTMAPLLPQLRGRRVVEVAAGTGRWASQCADHGASVIAIDCCFEMLAAGARQQNAVQADAMCLPLRDACADVVICAFGLGYAPDSLRELRRIAKSGATILVSDVHPDAIRRGWTRSFRHNGDVIHVAHRRYEIADLIAPDLHRTCLLEPRLGEPETEIFQRAGCPEQFAEASRGPAIFVAQWMRA